MLLTDIAVTRYAPQTAMRQEANKPGEVVGIISEKFGVAWTVSPHRVDARTGSIIPPIPMSEYWKAMGQSVSIK